MSLFVTFEGPEGSGKSTQLHLAAAWLRQQGQEVLTTREPGGTRIGDSIRSLLLDPDCVEMRPEAEILLFSAARAQLVGQIIRPHLAGGGIVLCDRFADSTLAYQGFGRGLDREMLQRITTFATGGLAPDLTIYLDLPPAEGLRRKRGGQGDDDWNRMEREQLEFHERVQHGYHQLAEAEPRRWLVIDASQPRDTVTERIRERLAVSLSLHR